MYPLKVNPICVLFRLNMEGTAGLHALPQWRCLLSFLPREPAVLVLRSRPHGALLPAHLRLPKQPHRQRGRAAHEGARALGGCAPVCQPPARRQQQPHSSCQTWPRGQPGQAALSSQGARGRGEEPMRPEWCWPHSSGHWSAAGALPGGELQWGRAQWDVMGPPGTRHSWVASLAAFHAPLLFLCCCRFVSLIYQHCLCLETFVKLFLFPSCPIHPRDTGRPRILACSCTSRLPILSEMDGWKQHITSRCEFWSKRCTQTPVTPQLKTEGKEYPGIFQFGLLFSEGIWLQPDLSQAILV